MQQTNIGGTIPYIGEIFSLATALTWAMAVILFKKSGESVHPIALSLFKDVLAIGLLIPTIYIMYGNLSYRADFYDYLILFISGCLGIGLGDTLFFMSLNKLGASLIAVVDCLYSPAVIILSFLFLGENLSLYQMIGVILIVAAIAVVIEIRSSGPISKQNLYLGILLGILSILANALGIVIVKPILEKTPILWATQIRLMGGVVVLILALLFQRRRRPILRSLISIGSWPYTFIGSFMGAYVSMMLWLGGMKYTQASISASLNQTSNIFVFVFAAIFLKETMGIRKILAIILAVLGAFIVMFL